MKPREASGEKCGSQGGKRREGAKGGKENERGSYGRRGPGTAGTQEGGKRRPRSFVLQAVAAEGPGRAGPTAQGDAATGQGGPDSASRGWEAWRTRRPSLLVPSDHSPPRSWGAPGNRAPSAPSVTPRLPRLTDPDPNPADRVARASRVVLRLRNLARAPPTAHAPPTSVTRQLGQPQLRRRTAAVPPLAGAAPTPLRSTCVLSHFLLFFSLPPPPGLGSLPAGFWACLLPLLCHVSRRLVLLLKRHRCSLGVVWFLLVLLKSPSQRDSVGCGSVCVSRCLRECLAEFPTRNQGRLHSLGPQPSLWVVSLGPQRSQEGINWTRPRRWMLPGIGIEIF